MKNIKSRRTITPKKNINSSEDKARRAAPKIKSLTLAEKKLSILAGVSALRLVAAYVEDGINNLLRSLDHLEGK
jgi:hypothetical protein